MGTSRRIQLLAQRTCSDLAVTMLIQRIGLSGQKFVLLPTDSNCLQIATSMESKCLRRLQGRGYENSRWSARAAHCPIIRCLSPAVRFSPRCLKPLPEVTTRSDPPPRSPLQMWTIVLLEIAEALGAENPPRGCFPGSSCHPVRSGRWWGLCPRCSSAGVIERHVFCILPQH